MTLIQSFAVNVRQYRRVGGLTQAQLAEALGLSVEMVGKIERGTSSPSFETIEKLSDVLKVPAAVLFGATADSLPQGQRATLLNEIHGHLANLNDGDLKRAPFGQCSRTIMLEDPSRSPWADHIVSSRA